MSGVSNTAPLRALLREAAVGLSSREQEAAVGSRRGKSWLNNILKEDHRKRLLDDEELEILSAAFRVPKRRIREADLEGHGLAERGSQPSTWLSQDEVAGLTEAQRVAVRGVILSMLKPDAPVAAAPTPSAEQYGRAAHVGPNRGAELRDELDRQAELVSPPPDHDEPA